MGLELVDQIGQGGLLQHAVAVQVDDIFPLAVVQRQVHGPGLALLRIHPLDAQPGKPGLALGEDGKALVLALVIHQEYPDALLGVGAVVNGPHTGQQRIRAVVHRNNQGNLRVEPGPGRRGKALDPPLQKQEHAAQGGQDLHQHRNDDPGPPEDKGVKYRF